METQPRWGDPVTISFAKRGTVPLLPAGSRVRPGGRRPSIHAACCCNARCDDTGSGSDPAPLGDSPDVVLDPDVVVLDRR